MSTVPPAQAPTVPPGGSPAPPPLQPGEVASSDAPTDVNPDKVVFLPPSTKTITRTWDEPVTHREVLGRIPADYYQPAWNPYPGSWGGSVFYPIGSGAFGMGQVDVARQVPDYNPDGTVRKETVTRTLSETTYDQRGRTLGLGIAGALAGGLAAAATGAIRGASVGAVGAVLGGLLGAATGALIGYKSAEGDQIREQWMRETISHPTLIGYQQWVNPDYRTEYETRVVYGSDGRPHEETVSHQVLQGWSVRFDPEIRWRSVGSYTYPTLEHTAKAGPVGSAFTAVGAGALAGVGVALAASLL
ncbi:MAG: hypothetical protein EB084_05300 [Proteobacteria bacterium]|nr:hypothetical protein [Pseudomonadota bacterium]